MVSARALHSDECTCALDINSTCISRCAFLHYEHCTVQSSCTRSILLEFAIRIESLGQHAFANSSQSLSQLANIIHSRRVYSQEIRPRRARHAAGRRRLPARERSAPSQSPSTQRGTGSRRASPLLPAARPRRVLRFGEQCSHARCSGFRYGARRGQRRELRRGDGDGWRRADARTARAILGYYTFSEFQLELASLSHIL